MKKKITTQKEQLNKNITDQIKQWFASLHMRLLDIIYGVIIVSLTYATLSITLKQANPNIILINTKALDEYRMDQEVFYNYKNGDIVSVPQISHGYFSFNPCIFTDYLTLNTPFFSISHQIRLSNLGGASDSIINFNIEINYLKYKLPLSSDGESEIYNTQSLNNLPFRRISILLTDTSTIGPCLTDDDLIPLPAPIKEKSTIDLYIIFIGEIDTTSPTLNDAMENPLSIVLELEFSSNDPLRIPLNTIGLFPLEH